MKLDLTTQYLNSLLQRILELEAAKRDIDYISDKEKEYFELVVKNSGFLFRCYRYALKVFILDLCNLMEVDEDRNMVSFIRYLLSNYRTIHWSNPVCMEKLRGFEHRLITISGMQDYEKLKNARDKFISHDDKDKLNYDIDFPISFGWSILEALKDIYSKLNYNLTGEKISFEMTTRPQSELESLAKYNRIERIIFDEYHNTRNENGLAHKEYWETKRHHSKL